MNQIALQNFFISMIAAVVHRLTAARQRIQNRHAAIKDCTKCSRPLTVYELTYCRAQSTSFSLSVTALVQITR